MHVPPQCYNDMDGYKICAIWRSLFVQKPPLDYADNSASFSFSQSASVHSRLKVASSSSSCESDPDPELLHNITCALSASEQFVCMGMNISK